MTDKQKNHSDNTSIVDVDGISASIKNYEEHIDFYSGEASKIARQLAFAIGAIVWLLYSETGYQYKPLVTISYIGLILFFIFDIIQYLFGAFKFSQLVYFLNNTRKQNPVGNLQYKYSYGFIRSLHTLYIIKFIFIGISSITLIIFFSIFLALPK
ncbi:hypothetical protein SC699_15410 [Legionella pneumophila serogroup 1]|nr:hypothetical protein [Legionella pneumophila]MDI9845859.1 hypothetical protein [Legionella pneumophila]HAW6248198.1 hypothetical protein [Legionella pneumophila]